MTKYNDHKHTEHINIDAKIAQGCEMTNKETHNNHTEGLARVIWVEGLLYPGTIVSESVQFQREALFLTRANSHIAQKRKPENSELIHV